MLRDQFAKPTNYPMAIVTAVTENDIGEVTAVKAKKGSTGEHVYRHVESVIPLLSRLEYAGSNEELVNSVPPSENEVSRDFNCGGETSQLNSKMRNSNRPIRKAFKKAAEKIKQQIEQVYLSLN